MCTQLAEVTSISAVKTMSRTWKAAAISEIGGRRKERQSLKSLPGANPCSGSGLESGVRGGGRTVEKEIHSGNVSFCFLPEGVDVDRHYLTRKARPGI